MKLIEAHLRTDRNLPQDFVFTRYEWLDGAKPAIMRIEGGCCPLLKTGPHKGTPNWRRLTDGQTFHLTAAQLVAIDLAYEAATGNCVSCLGYGQKPWRSSKADGTEYKPCRVCVGTGKAAQQ